MLRGHWTPAADPWPPCWREKEKGEIPSKVLLSFTLEKSWITAYRQVVTSVNSSGLWIMQSFSSHIIQCIYLFTFALNVPTAFWKTTSCFCALWHWLNASLYDIHSFETDTASGLWIICSYSKLDQQCRQYFSSQLRSRIWPTCVIQVSMGSVRSKASRAPSSNMCRNFLPTFILEKQLK